MTSDGSDSSSSSLISQSGRLGPYLALLIFLASIACFSLPPALLLKARARCGDLEAAYELSNETGSTESIHWLKRAADGGHVLSRLKLADQYRAKARRVSRMAGSEERLISLTEQAAVYGSSEAVLSLYLLSTGSDPSFPPARVRELIRNQLSAGTFLEAEGRDQARLLLALMLEEGHGGPRDLGRAYSYYSQVAAECRDPAFLRKSVAGVGRLSSVVTPAVPVPVPFQNSSQERNRDE